MRINSLWLQWKNFYKLIVGFQLLILELKTMGQFTKRDWNVMLIFWMLEQRSLHLVRWELEVLFTQISSKLTLVSTGMICFKHSITKYHFQVFGLIPMSSQVFVLVNVLFLLILLFSITIMIYLTHPELMIYKATQFH